MCKYFAFFSARPPLRPLDRHKIFLSLCGARQAAEHPAIALPRPVVGRTFSMKLKLSIKRPLTLRGGMHGSFSVRWKNIVLGPNRAAPPGFFLPLASSAFNCLFLFRMLIYFFSMGYNHVWYENNAKQLSTNVSIALERVWNIGMRISILAWFGCCTNLISLLADGKHLHSAAEC